MLTLAIAVVVIGLGVILLSVAVDKLSRTMRFTLSELACYRIKLYELDRDLVPKPKRKYTKRGVQYKTTTRPDSSPPKYKSGRKVYKTRKPLDGWAKRRMSIAGKKSWSNLTTEQRAIRVDKVRRTRQLNKILRASKN